MQHAWMAATRESARDESQLRQLRMSIHTIATILTIVCLGVAFIWWSWLSIEETRRHTRRNAPEREPIPRAIGS